MLSGRDPAHRSWLNHARDRTRRKADTDLHMLIRLTINEKSSSLVPVSDEDGYGLVDSRPAPTQRGRSAKHLRTSSHETLSPDDEDTDSHVRLTWKGSADIDELPLRTVQISRSVIRKSTYRVLNIQVDLEASRGRQARTRTRVWIAVVSGQPCSTSPSSSRFANAPSNIPGSTRPRNPFHERFKPSTASSGTSRFPVNNAALRSYLPSSDRLV